MNPLFESRLKVSNEGMYTSLYTLNRSNMPFEKSIYDMHMYVFYPLKSVSERRAKKTPPLKLNLKLDRTMKFEEIISQDWNQSN
jgi:hypothetical protein